LPLRGKQNALPADAPWPMIESNISLTGFNLGGNLDRVPGALKELSVLFSKSVMAAMLRGVFNRCMARGANSLNSRLLANESKVSSSDRITRPD
jgi:hypothetical protein